MNAILAVAVTLMPQVAAAPAPDLPPTTVALVETYADGRVNYELTSAKPAWMWTPYFPRLSGWQPTPAVPTVKALKLARVLVGRDVKVDVSVLAPTLQDEIAVTTVMVRPGARVMVEEIRKYGIAPVELSLAETAPMTPYRPTVVSVTPNVEIADLSLLTAPYPGYRITVRNLSNKAVVDFHVQTYRGGEKALSSLQRGTEGHPAMTPGQTFTFEVKLTSGKKTDSGLWAPTPIDVLDIDSVRWDDNTVDGPSIPPSGFIASDAGARLQFTRINAILRRAIDRMADGTDTLARVKAQIAALRDHDEGQLPAAQNSMRGVKAAALAELTRFEQDRSTSHDTADVARWVQDLIDRNDRAIARLAQ